MNDKHIIPINIINLGLIIIIMIIVAMLTQNIIAELTLKDIQNVTRLTQTNISAEINKELIEPVNTSIIMAQNTFLHEHMDFDTDETEALLSKYLTAVQKSTGYESVFIVPHSTLNYYHPGGTESKVELEEESSSWYRTMMNSKEEYSINVNVEQLDNWAFTVYVNANMKDEEGDFIGLTGVGTRITHIQDILASYMNSQGVKAYLVNEEGLIQIHHNEEMINSMSFYELEDISKEYMLIKGNRNSHLEKQIGNKFLVVEHIAMLNWYLVVSKSTSELTPSLNIYSNNMYRALVIAALSMMMATSFTIWRYKKQIIALSNTDKLTVVPNRRIFEDRLKNAIKASHKQIFTLAIFDIDNLKKINDNLGHDQGDFVLKTIAAITKEQIDKADIVSRIGGDEFTIIYYKPLEEAKTNLGLFLESVQSNEELIKLNATISIGVSEVKTLDDEKSLFKRVDDALYNSKNTGRNKITVI